MAANELSPESVEEFEATLPAGMQNEDPSNVVSDLPARTVAKTPSEEIQAAFKRVLDQMNDNYDSIRECVRGSLASSHRTGQLTPYLERIVMVSLQDLHKDAVYEVERLMNKVVDKYDAYETALTVEKGNLNRLTVQFKDQISQSAALTKRLESKDQELVMARSTLASQASLIQHLQNDFCQAQNNLRQAQDNLMLIKARVDQLMASTRTPPKQDQDDPPVRAPVTQRGQSAT